MDAKNESQQKHTAWGPPMNSDQLRRVADFAGAVRGAELWTEYDKPRRKIHRSHAELNTAETAFVPTRTRPDAIRPLVATVSPGIDGPDLVKAGADALFWSEGAVEKFLFPYYASAAGWDAEVFLRRLNDAWYRYDATRVQVLALAHLAKSPGEDENLTLENSVGVVYARYVGTGLGKADLLRLPEFLDRFGMLPFDPEPLPLPPIPASPPARGTAKERQPFNSVQVRRITETTSGVRGVPVWFTLHNGEISASEQPPVSVAPTDTVILGATETRRARPAPEGYSIESLNGPFLERASLDGYDAVFWTDGAVERFMLPYYASVMGYQAVPFLTELMKIWAPGSVAGGIRETVEEDTTKVYAMAHYPRSEYVQMETTDPTAQTAEHEKMLGSVGLIAHGHAKPVRHRSFAELRAVLSASAAPAPQQEERELAGV
jgi:hypothetical protein